MERFEYNKAWHAAHPGAAAAATQRWRDRFPEKVIATEKKRWAKDKVALTAKHRKWKTANPKRWTYLNKRKDLKKFGLTPEDYDRMLSAQRGLCAICRKVPTHKRGFAVDHDHATGKVRGILCGHCNSGLGLLRDDALIVSAAARYLRRHTAK